MLYDSLEGWDRVGDGREVQEGGDKCIPVADSCRVWQKRAQYCKAIIFQLKKKKGCRNKGQEGCSQKIQKGRIIWKLLPAALTTYQCRRFSREHSKLWTKHHPAISKVHTPAHRSHQKKNGFFSLPPSEPHMRATH